MKLTRAEYENLSGEAKKKYLDGLTPEEMAALYSVPSPFRVVEPVQPPRPVIQPPVPVITQVRAEIVNRDTIEGLIKAYWGNYGSSEGGRYFLANIFQEIEFRDKRKKHDHNRDGAKTGMVAFGLGFGLLGIIASSFVASVASQAWDEQVSMVHNKNKTVDQVMAENEIMDEVQRMLVAPSVIMVIVQPYLQTMPHKLSLVKKTSEPTKPEPS